MAYQKIRRTAGNLCLFLMASMIVLAVAMTAVPSTAHAAPEGEVQMDVDVSDIRVEHVDGGAHKLSFLLELTPTTDDQYTSVLINVTVYDSYDGDDSITFQKVYGNVYETFKAGKVTAIHVVYGNVYDAPPQFTMPDRLTVADKRAVGNLVYEVVYVNLVFRPPRPSAGGVAVVSPGVVTVPTDTGILTVDEASGTSSFTPVAERVAQQIELFAKTALETGERTFTLVDATNSGVPKLEVALPADVLDTFAKSPSAQMVEYIAAKAPDVDLELPVKELLEQVASYKGTETVGGAVPGEGAAGLKVVLGAADEATSAEVLRTAPPDTGSQVASRVYDLELHVTRFGQTVGRITSLSKPMRARFSYNVQPGLKETTLTSYRLVNGQWVPVGGWPVYKERKVYTQLWGASKFTVMAYDKTFDDIKGHWAQGNVELLAGRRVIKGVTDTTFEPESPLTRAQFAALTVRLLGLPERKPAQPTFTDVNPDDWFFGAVETAASFGLVRGMGDGTFRPNDKVTREQLAVMVVNAMNVAGMPASLQAGELESLLAGFADADQLSDWARQQAAIAAKHGIVKGRGPATLEPKADATRAEGSTMLVRLLAYLGRY
ncbi:MAG: S-layer homology domain-containing protein [Bacillota bacterium]